LKYTLKAKQEKQSPYGSELRFAPSKEDYFDREQPKETLSAAQLRQRES